MISPIKIRCRSCGKVFTTTIKSRVYCSNVCRIKYYSKLHIKNTKIRKYEIMCKYCKNIFITDQPNRKYCNNDCLKNYYKENSKKTKTKTVYDKCVVCNEEFLKTAKYHICCSENCKEKHRIRNLSVGRFVIFNRDNFTCIYCGRNSIEDNIKLHVDHIIPISKGGKNTADNLVTSCEDCNLEKHNTVIESKKIIEIVDARNKKNKIENKAKINNSDYISRINRLSNKSYING